VADAGVVVTAAEIVAAVRARGSDARDVRDAVHEAHHAITAGAARWDRDSIHNAVTARWPGRRGLSDRAANEIECRAAEWAACDAFGIAYEPESWVGIMCMEACKDGIVVPYGPMLAAVRGCRASRGADLYAAVLAALA
jgi:hypothetical protein